MPNRLKAVREKKGISMSELARRSGVCRSTIWKIETGNKQARTTRTLEKIANALGVPIREIFDI